LKEKAILPIFYLFFDKAKAFRKVNNE